MSVGVDVLNGPAFMIGALALSATPAMADGHGRDVDAARFMEMAQACAQAVADGLPLPHVIPEGASLVVRGDFEDFFVDLGAYAQDPDDISFGGFLAREVETGAIQACLFDYRVRDETADEDRAVVAELEAQMAAWLNDLPPAEDPGADTIGGDVVVLCGAAGGAWISARRAIHDNDLFYRAFPADGVDACDEG